MTHSEAAEGRRLLEEYDPADGYTTDCAALEDWLWSNREELVRCAELASQPHPPQESERKVSK